MCLVPLLFAYVKATQTVSICASTTSAGWSRTLTSVAINIGKLRTSFAWGGYPVDQELVHCKPGLSPLEGMAGTTGLEPAASGAIVPSGTLRITNLHVDSEFVIVAEVNDVVAAVAGASGTTQALSMDRKQKRCPANRHVRIIDRGFDGIHREI